MIQYFHRPSIIRNTYHKFKLLPLLYLLTLGCASVKQLAVENDAERLLKQSEVFSNQFTGFSLYDIESNTFITSHNSTLKFTPASNTKLLTMYATLKSFGDSLPSLLYEKRENQLYVSPIGDPTFLYDPFGNQPTYSFLNAQDTISITWPEEDPSHFGSGWAWDDYIYNFQPQRAWWPIHGNTVSIKKVNDSLNITPSFFEEYVEILKQVKPGELVDRDIKFNLFRAYLESDTTDFKRVIPFEYSRELLTQLLQDTLQTNIRTTNTPLIRPDTLYSHHIDTVLALMLKPSDNFLAEQLLLMAAWKNGHREVKPFIEEVRNTWFLSLTDMVWVDGSGLSRYNLIAPVDQVRLLKICLDEFGWERMTKLLPTGGEGTLEELYIPKEDELPYLFAKTGTLSNNHNLSGYLVTKSGKRMIFSFMNNHYTRPTEEVKKAMEQFISKIRNAY